MQLKEQEDHMIKGLFSEIIKYYGKLVQSEELPDQGQVEDVSVCFRIMCQIVDSFLSGYQELQEHYQLLEEQLIKSEAENRNHIRIEQQLKIFAESLQEQNELQEKTLIQLQKQMDSVGKELLKLKKPQLSQERLNTDSTLDRFQTLISHQKSNTIPLKLRKKKNTELLQDQRTRSQLSGHISVQQSTLDKLQETAHIYTKKKKQIKQRANTIHVSDQPTRQKSGKLKTRMNTSCNHYNEY